MKLKRNKPFLKIYLLTKNDIKKSSCQIMELRDLSSWFQTISDMVLSLKIRFRNEVIGT